jgi:hypothetical protein
MNKPTAYFHGAYEQNLALGYVRPTFNPTIRHFTQTIRERQLSYSVNSHFHPYVPQLLQRLFKSSIPGLQAADTEYQLNADGSFKKFPNDYPDTDKRGQPIPTLFKDFFQDLYAPNPGKINDLVLQPYPVKDLDFTHSGAYSVYNWELFYHIPVIIAINLSRNGRYQDAQQWFHYIFDPTDNSDGPTPERFWKVKPFQTTHTRVIEDILINLSTGQDEQLRQDTLNCIYAWKENPFRPHLIARYRQSAYMLKAVFAYIDNLIAWGDDDFRKDQPEDVDAALLKYVLAANILGPKPQEVPSKGRVQAATYASLRNQLNALGNTLVPLETEIPFNIVPHTGDTPDDESFKAISGLGSSLYFGIPRNEKLLAYWDTVADRLFKIRNSENLQGIFRQLPLFSPPIDPALLARAVAAGLDIGAAISGLNAPLPIVRYTLLAQKAMDLCQEVKSLGSGLLSAMEKQDNETLAILRAHHETMLLSLTESVRYAQLQDATKTVEGLKVSLTNAVNRYIYFERQLNKTESDIRSKLPDLSDLDIDGLMSLKFKSKEPELGLRDLNVDIAKDLNSSGGKIVSSYELEELQRLAEARDLHDAVQGTQLGAKAIALLPQFGIKLHFWGLGGDATFGGTELAALANFAADVLNTVADHKGYEAGNAAKIGGYARRELEWAFQSNSVAGEISQLYKQIRGAQIREAIAGRELSNHRQQMKNAQTIEDFLSNEKTRKKTNKDLYAWMVRETRGLYTNSMQFAREIAKKAERALQRELGDQALTYIGFDYLSGKEGLLAGEKLFFDLKQMEMAWYERNKREYEMSTHISLLQLSPAALLQLRTTGRCQVTIPEEWFDREGPGHYFRRIKSVSVSVPCIAGPYTSVNCTMTLTKSVIRTSALLSDGNYAAADNNDIRFDTFFGSMESIVTSSAQNDSGLFEANLHDERVLPFEYAGVVSTWQLTLPGYNGGLRQFNYDTITDLIIHMRYTAREGGDLLRKGAMDNLQSLIAASTTAGTTRLFSIRHEFPNDWEKFRSATINVQNPFALLSLTLKEEHYPFWSKGFTDVNHGTVLYARGGKNAITLRADPQDAAKQDLLNEDKALGSLRVGKLDKIPLPAPVGAFSLFLDDNSISDLWIAVAWGK